MGETSQLRVIANEDAMELLRCEYGCLATETVIRDRLMRVDRRLAKNPSANLRRRGATVVLALLLLPVFVRDMTSASCSLWLLVLQASVQIGYLPGVCRHFSASFATTAIMNVSCGTSRKVSRSGVHSSLHQPAAAFNETGGEVLGRPLPVNLPGRP